MIVFASATLAVVVGIVLLIACSNVANLLLARTAGGRRRWRCAWRSVQGVAIDQGREFADTDRSTSTLVAIVNDKLALDQWPGESALGKRIQLLIMRHGLSLVSAAGVAIGLLLAIGVGRLLRGMLFGVGAGDPISLAIAAVTLSTIALIACYLPARWATRVDPLVTLRHD